ncbi:MAG: biopolymer transporter ExbD [Planctomycetota bacterium]
MNLARQGTEDERIELQMTSMIDCVFLLLIFFVMTMKFPKVEGRLPAHLPRQGRATSTKKEKTEEIVIGLEYPNKQLVILVNGANIGERIDALRTKLFLLRRQIPEAKVTIDGAPDVPYDYIVKALNACAKFGFKKVQFAEPRGQV